MSSYLETVQNPIIISLSPPNQKELLTPAQINVIRGFCKHQDLHKAADELYITYETARTHLVDIFKAFGATSQFDLFSKLVAFGCYDEPLQVRTYRQQKVHCTTPIIVERKH